MSSFALNYLLKIDVAGGFYIKNSAVSKDGKELYTFDNAGRHLTTQDTLTNQILYRFSYEPNGYLCTITNVDGDITSIERLTDGKPLAIIAADGERTEITLDAKVISTR